MRERTNTTQMNHRPLSTLQTLQHITPIVSYQQHANQNKPCKEKNQLSFYTFPIASHQLPSIFHFSKGKVSRYQHPPPAFVPHKLNFAKYYDTNLKPNIQRYVQGHPTQSAHLYNNPVLYCSPRLLLTILRSFSIILHPHSYSFFYQLQE